jgi:hypothetical protein
MLPSLQHFLPFHIIVRILITLLVFDDVAVLICEALKMEAVHLPEAQVFTYEYTRRHNPEEQHRHFYRCSNLKSNYICCRVQNV